MITIGKKRGKIFPANGTLGGKRVRLSLGVGNKVSAENLILNINLALSKGTSSELWHELHGVLPSNTFNRLAQSVRWVPPVEKAEPSWAELCTSFGTSMAQRLECGKLADTTVERYSRTIREFGSFLREKNITLLSNINTLLTDEFKVWRTRRIRAKKFSRGATSIELDAAILHNVFNHAIESEMVSKNPIRTESAPGRQPTVGAQPYDGEELRKLRIHAGDDLLTFLLLRHTGLRGSDAVRLTWKEVHFERREIERITQKRKKLVVMPIHAELLFALECEHARRDPQAHDTVLINPETGMSMSRPRLYKRIAAIGKRAGVSHAHPHRFRDTLAVDLLCKGLGIYDVAQILGDAVGTVEKHYAPFVSVLRDRARRFMEMGEGIEQRGTKMAHSVADSSEVVENAAAGPVSRILSALQRDGHSSGPSIAERL
jgi:integrase/recombinase XerD